MSIIDIDTHALIAFADCWKVFTLLYDIQNNLYSLKIEMIYSPYHTKGHITHAKLIFSVEKLS